MNFQQICFQILIIPFRLPEIEARPTTFETKVPQPRTCVPASNEL